MVAQTDTAQLFADKPWLDSSAVPFVQVRALTKTFGSFTAVSSVDLDIYEGELFSLLGGSGCGKSTLLRMLAGFDPPTSGTVLIDGVDMAGVPPYQRPVNMMFQSYALFPHMTVAQNVAYGLKQDRVAKQEIESRVENMLATVELLTFAKHKPHQLSGGQRQRVALARALVRNPKVLLLDEPLGALDKRLREQTQFELMNIQEELGITFIVVTHDQEEAMTLSTRIAVMDQGQFSQIGTPTDIYEYPETRFVANFIGNANMFEGRVKENHADSVIVEVADSDLSLLIDHSASVRENTLVWVALRPEKILVSATPPAEESEHNSIEGVVDDIGYLGNFSIYKIRLPNSKIVEVTHPNQHRPKHGRHLVEWEEKVYLSWAASSPVLLTK